MDRSRTKQVCTIGPASAAKIAELVAAGMDVARVNFSHGTPDAHRDYVHAVRSAAHSARRSVAVLVDLPGPKLRIGTVDGGEVRLEAGTQFRLRADDGQPGDAGGAAVSTTSLADQLQPGDRVLLADGAVELRVTSRDGPDVVTEVIHGGLIRSRSGLNIPSERLTGEGLTEADRAAIPRALELRADLIAQSFVRSADDIRALRALLPADGPRVVAKIETRAAIDNFDAICAEADGIMVARGDMGVDIPFEEVPFVQKDLIARATNADKFTIVATQMLESMTVSPRPTRAEASDVANAVLDGADAVMLSAETAIGAFPVEALTAMDRICASIEQHRAASYASPEDDKVDGAHALVLMATLMTEHTDADALWCFTRSGRTAEMLSMTRPRVPIVAFTLSPIVARRLAVRRGVVPIVLPAGPRQPQSPAITQPLIDRMHMAWRAQRGTAEHSVVLMVTTSPRPDGINRLEIQRLATQPAPSAQRSPGSGTGARGRQQVDGRRPEATQRATTDQPRPPVEPEPAAAREPATATAPEPEPARIAEPEPERATAAEPEAEPEPEPEPARIAEPEPEPGPPIARVESQEPTPT